LKVVGPVDRPAHLALVGPLAEEVLREHLRMPVEERRDVFALVGIGGLAGGAAEGLGAHDLDVQPPGKGAMGRGVGGVVEAPVDQQGDNGVDHLGIGQGTVAGQAHQRLGGAEGLQRACEAGQHVVQRAAMHRDPVEGQHGGQAVVAGVRGGGHHDAVEASGAAQAFYLTQDHRRPRHLRHDLARQAGGRHAGLKDGEDHAVIVAGVRPTRACGSRRP
jgi:hypothetical protein